ncbi:hypothetical protein [Qipengyuania spongiae]|uniref:Uncharacterized protein n=1 Tax=Qipengyuania spongiae TaxID=2909673 RepID=A0ABY5SZH2_9SPHN|nr:hypothetical protein [Qipengyuania spongiae]UVI39927.1 hypothetical protein L1F33_02910 [Qipengyuania spongiae]
MGERVEEAEFEAVLSERNYRRAAYLLLGKHVKIARLTPENGSVAILARCARSSVSAVGDDLPRALLAAWIARNLRAVRFEDPSIKFA